MKQTLVLLAASALLYSCSPKVSHSVADSSSSSSNTNTPMENSNTPKLKSSNATDVAQPATAIPSR